MDSYITEWQQPNISSKKENKNGKKVRSFNGRYSPNYSTEALGTELDKYDWSLILSKDNPNEQLNYK